MRLSITMHQANADLAEFPGPPDEQFRPNDGVLRISTHCLNRRDLFQLLKNPEVTHGSGMQYGIHAMKGLPQGLNLGAR